MSSAPRHAEVGLSQPVRVGYFEELKGLIAMEKLQITAQLAGPLITGGGYMTFDALLAAVVFDMTGDLDRAHNELPLAKINGMYRASAALFESIKSEPVTLTQTLRPDDLWLDHQLFKKNNHGKVHRRFDQYNIMNTYRCISADSVAWYCEGDVDKIRELLTNLPMIGKKRSAVVSKWDIEESEIDGVIGYDDEPLRPIPVDMFKGNKSNAVMVDAAWRPAYWSAANRRACYVSLQ
jgi:hypothetical protein